MVPLAVMIGGLVLLAMSSRLGAWAHRTYLPPPGAAIAPRLASLFENEGFFRYTYAGNGLLAAIAGGLAAVGVVRSDFLFGVCVIALGSELVLESQRTIDTKEGPPPFGWQTWSSWFSFGMGIFLVLLGIVSWVIVLAEP